MDVLELDGVTYVKATKAARAAGYTADYVGQLCRSGAIKAHLVGRSWYVNEVQLRDHKVTKKRTQRVKAREQIKQAQVDQQEKGNAAPSSYLTRLKQSTQAKYEADDSELMPTVKKLAVRLDTTEPKAVKQPKATTKREPNYEIEHKGEEIVMSGSVKVVDATDEFLLDPAATILQPKIQIRKTQKPAKAPETSKSTEKKASPHKIVAEETVDEPVSTKRSEQKTERSSFLEKLTAFEEEKNNEIPIQNLNQVVVEEENEPDSSKMANNSSKSSIAEYGTVPITTFGLTLAVTVVLFMLLLEGHWAYTAEVTGRNAAPSSVVSHYTLDPSDLVANISF